MIEDFISKHKKLVVLTVIIIVIGFVILIFSSTPNQTDKTEPIVTGDYDDTGPFPYSNYLYTIKYTSQSSNDSLTIDAAPGYRNAAIKKLIDSGLDPTNYKITFTYESPFEKYE